MHQLKTFNDINLPRRLLSIHTPSLVLYNCQRIRSTFERFSTMHLIVAKRNRCGVASCFCNFLLVSRVVEESTKRRRKKWFCREGVLRDRDDAWLVLESRSVDKTTPRLLVIPSRITGRSVESFLLCSPHIYEISLWESSTPIGLFYFYLLAEILANGTSMLLHSPYWPNFNRQAFASRHTMTFRTVSICHTQTPTKGHFVTRVSFDITNGLLSRPIRLLCKIQVLTFLTLKRNNVVLWNWHLQRLQK